ncbi:MAG: oligoendopeptidase F [bacterium]|nr:oligoendopeptidase F [bacterium]
MKTWKWAICLLCILALSLNAFGKGAKTRSDIPDKYKWQPSHIYANLEAWQKDFDALKAGVDKLAAFKGSFAGDKATNPAQALIDFNKISEDAWKKFERAWTYVNFNADVDLANPDWSGRDQQMQMLAVEYGQALAWVDPEILQIPQATMHKYIESNKELEAYRKSYDDLYAKQEHVLTEPEERILALSGNVVGAPSETYGKLTDVDMRWPSILDEKGDSIVVNDAAWVSWRTNPDRRIRRDFFNTLFSGYKQFGNTMAALMNGNVQKNVYFTRARKYETTLQAALSGNFIPEQVYINLVETTKKNTAPLHKYNEVRKRLMGVDTLRHWDYYASVIDLPEDRYTWEQGVAMVTDALKVLGPQFNADITKGLNPGSGWVDVYTSQSKRGGAYSSGCYGIHPYMLYNFDVDKGLNIDDVSTIAHEVGHSMHSYYSEKTQAFPNKDYAIFNAEVASTTNEAIFNQKALDEARATYQKAKGDAKKVAKQKLMALLENNISGARDTFYRQTMFASWEWEVNKLGEAGEPITSEALSDIYLNLYKTWQGPAMDFTDLSAVEWMYIPHFYRSYYVYSYATSYAAAIALASDIMAEAGGDKAKKGARDRYITYLQSGSSKHPVELLKDAGVDMTTPAPIEAFVKWFSNMVNELDQLSKTT